MKLLGIHPERSPAPRGRFAPCAGRWLVWLLAATLLMPVWMLPRAAAMLPLAPVQSPSEEESPSSHSVVVQIQQLSATSGRSARRLAVGRAQRWHLGRLGLPAVRLNSARFVPNCEATRRNGCGGPLRC